MKGVIMDVFLLGKFYHLTAQFFTGALLGFGLFIVLRAFFESKLIKHLRIKLTRCNVVRKRLFQEVTDLTLLKYKQIGKIENLEKQLAFEENNNKELGDVIIDLSKKNELLYIEKDKYAVELGKLKTGYFGKTVITKEGRIKSDEH